MPEVYFSDDQLMHYGVKGMRWGKRKSSRSSSTKSKTAKKRKATFKEAYKNLSPEDQRTARKTLIQMGLSAVGSAVGGGIALNQLSTKSTGSDLIDVGIVVVSTLTGGSLLRSLVR